MAGTRGRKLGDATVVTLTPEMLAALGAVEGDRLTVVRAGDGTLGIVKHDPAVEAALAAAEVVMDENDELLRKLA